MAIFSSDAESYSSGREGILPALSALLYDSNGTYAQLWQCYTNFLSVVIGFWPAIP